jgi:hypothetical protein
MAQKSPSDDGAQHKKNDFPKSNYIQICSTRAEAEKRAAKKGFTGKLFSIHKKKTEARRANMKHRGASYRARGKDTHEIAQKVFLWKSFSA